MERGIANPLNQHIENVCKPGKVDCCRYLMMGDGWECAKLDQPFKVLLDERVKSGTIRAVGDNCEGKDKQFLNSEKS